MRLDHGVVYIMQKTIQTEFPDDETMKAIAKEWSMLTREQIMESCRQEGLQEGRQEGVTETRQMHAERMINKGMSNSQISEITDLTLDEIRALKNGDNSAG